ncbi:MAG: HAMP domain-containing sensor histidine kinase [bacterium]|nr:HAMP domain-containing sensor histidine kinase [bacterium]
MSGDIYLTLDIFLIVAYFFLISIKKETEQKEQSVRLNLQLDAANKQLKKLDAAKSEFISLASHQLRAPLTVIKGYLSLALEGTLGAITTQTKESLGKAAFSTEQLVKLVNELLDLSRIESGKIKYEFTTNDLVKIMDEVADELRPQADAKHIVLKVEAERGLPQFIFDRDKMREVIINLIHNAVKYTPEGNITVRAEIITKSTGKVVRLSVKDNGMGIVKEEISKLFTKFGRAESARVVDPNGMGLGLFFVKKVAEDHGGTAWVESHGLNKGSTFIVELPLKTNI